MLHLSKYIIHMNVCGYKLTEAFRAEHAFFLKFLLHMDDSGHLTYTDDSFKCKKSWNKYFKTPIHILINDLISNKLLEKTSHGYKFNYKNIAGYRYTKQSITYSDTFIEQYNQIKSIYDFKHKLDIDKPTKTLLKSQKYIAELLNGDFFKKHSFDEDWLTKIKIRPYTWQEILHGVELFRKKRNTGNLAYYSKISLPMFLYNPVTHKSLCLELIQDNYNFDTEEERTIYFRETQWLADMARFDNDIVAERLYPVYEYFKEFFYRLERLAEKTNTLIYWRKHYGIEFNWKYFVSDIYNFIKPQRNFKPEYLGYKNNFWYAFVKYMRHTYNVYIIFNLDFFKEEK